MMQEIQFALYAIKKNIQSSAELRTSFLMNVVGMAVNNTAFILLWIFFVQSVGIIGGWTALDVVALQGFTALSYGIVFSVGAGIRKLPDYVASGTFDRFMLSPKNILLRTSTASFGASAVGDIAFGIICLIIFGIMTHITLMQAGVIVLLVILTTILFFAVIVTVYSTSFLFVDANSVTNGIFELFFTPSLFHGGAFQGATRAFFMFVIPSLLVGAIPVEIIKTLSLEKLAVVSIFTIIWFFISLKTFNWAVRRYESSNFMTFGG